MKLTLLPATFHRARSIRLIRLQPAATPHCLVNETTFLTAEWFKIHKSPNLLLKNCHETLSSPVPGKLDFSYKLLKTCFYHTDWKVTNPSIEILIRMLVNAFFPPFYKSAYNLEPVFVCVLLPHWKSDKVKQPITAVSTWYLRALAHSSCGFKSSLILIAFAETASAKQAMKY